MSALAKDRMLRFVKATYLQFPLADSVEAFKGALAVADTATAHVKPGTTGANQKVLGVFAEHVDNSSGSDDPLVTVDFMHEKTLLWMANDTGTPVTALFSTCYILDDQTVTGSSGGSASSAGMVWGIDAVKGVLIEVGG